MTFNVENEVETSWAASNCASVAPNSTNSHSSSRATSRLGWIMWPNHHTTTQICRFDVQIKAIISRLVEFAAQGRWNPHCWKIPSFNFLWSFESNDWFHSARPTLELSYPLRSIHVSVPSVLLCNYLNLSRHANRWPKVSTLLRKD